MIIICSWKNTGVSDYKYCLGKHINSQSLAPLFPQTMIARNHIVQSFFQSSKTVTRVFNGQYQHLLPFYTSMNI